MDQIRKQVAQARRRLLAEQFLANLIWCLCGALLVALVAIALPKLVVVTGLPAQWTATWVIGGLLAATVAAAVWTWLAGRDDLDAAIELDKRFGLRERLASAISLSEDDRGSEAGQALLRDATRSARRVEVADKFRVGFQKRAWLPIVPGMLVFVLATFVDNRSADSRVDPASAASAKQQVKKSAESLRKRLAERRKRAVEQGLDSAAGLFKKLEQGSRELSKKSDVDRKRALVKLNDLADELDERRKKIGGLNQLKKQLASLKTAAGPANKLSRALKQGNWQKALDELAKLQKSLEEGKLDAASQKNLQAQLKDIQQQLQKTAQAHKQAMEDLRQQIARERKQGNNAKAAEMQQMLDKLAQQMPQMNNMQQLAQQLGNCQKCMQDGDGKGAAQALAKMGQQLAQVQQQMAEMDMLTEAMDQIEMTKQSMNCQQCGGSGCQACMGSEFNNLMSEGGGMGMQSGQGRGPRPDEENPVNFRDSLVRQKTTPGAAVMTGLADGPNIQGQVIEQIKEEMDLGQFEAADPVTIERLSRSRREHAEEYFDILNE